MVIKDNSKHTKIENSAWWHLLSHAFFPVSAGAKRGVRTVLWPIWLQVFGGRQRLDRKRDRGCWKAAQPHVATRRTRADGPQKRQPSNQMRPHANQALELQARMGCKRDRGCWNAAEPVPPHGDQTGTGRKRDSLRIRCDPMPTKHSSFRHAWTAKGTGVAGMRPNRMWPLGEHGQTGHKRDTAEHKADQPVPRTRGSETDGPQKGKGVSG